MSRFVIGNKEVSELQVSLFWTRVNVGPVGECWKWLGGKNSNKKNFTYGCCWINNKRMLAHRAAYLFHTGTLSNKAGSHGISVLHTCDNPACCNPNHLYEGTHLDNMKDKMNRGRGNQEKGSSRYNAKLTVTVVRRIREMYDSGKYLNKEIAQKLKVGVSLVSKVGTRKAWIHVSEE